MPYEALLQRLKFFTAIRAGSNMQEVNKNIINDVTIDVKIYKIMQ